MTSRESRYAWQHTPRPRLYGDPPTYDDASAARYDEQVDRLIANAEQAATRKPRHRRVVHPWPDMPQDQHDKLVERIKRAYGHYPLNDHEDRDARRRFWRGTL